MTAQDIQHIVWTVSWIQIVGEIVSYYRTFKSPKYRRTIDTLESKKYAVDRCKKELEAKKGTKNASNLEKKLKRAETELNVAAANVAKNHVWHKMVMTGIFVILFRILGAEYGGKIVALLPFRPPGFLQRVTMRNIEFDNVMQYDAASEHVYDKSQAGAFVVIYLLTNISVKYYIQQLFGTDMPEGTDAMSSIINTPLGQSTMRSFGVDPEMLKYD